MNNIIDISNLYPSKMLITIIEDNKKINQTKYFSKIKFIFNIIKTILQNRQKLYIISTPNYIIEHKIINNKYKFNILKHDYSNLQKERY